MKLTVAQFAAACARLGFHVEETGGGCTWLRRQPASDVQHIVTMAGEARAPRRYEDGPLDLTVERKSLDGDWIPIYHEQFADGYAMVRWLSPQEVTR